MASLSIAAQDWHRHHADLAGTENLQTILFQLHTWIDAVADTCFELAGQLAEQGEFDDFVLVTAQVATTSGDILTAVADATEREYLFMDRSDDHWAVVAAIAAGLRTTVDHLRRAT